MSYHRMTPAQINNLAKPSRRLSIVVKIGILVFCLLFLRGYTADANQQPNTQFMPPQDVVSIQTEATQRSARTSDIPWLPPEVVRWKDFIEKSANRNDVDPDLVAIIIIVESRGDLNAFNQESGAMGLMQLMPGTADDMASQLGYIQYDVFDPATNIEFGTRYIAQMLDGFGWDDENSDRAGSIWNASGAYNWGIGNFQKFLASNQFLPQETINYTYWVSGMWQEKHKKTSTVYDQLVSETSK